MLTATDRNLSGGGTVDKFSVKIWAKATAEVIYEIQMDEADDSDAGTGLGGGRRRSRLI